jgi:hypothetical protein
MASVAKGLATRIICSAKYSTGLAHGVRAWKASAPLLIINEDGKPSDGMFKRFRGLADPITSENYQRQRVQLWQEDWSEVELPSAPEEIVEAYDRVGPTS